jgi:hypothetical protein
MGRINWHLSDVAADGLTHAEQAQSASSDDFSALSNSAS